MEAAIITAKETGPEVHCHVLKSVFRTKSQHTDR
jgi:hypothetical protein